MPHKKIFISQGTLELGRGRPQRRLERQLDNELETFNKLFKTEVLPIGTGFCEYAGTKFECCKRKVCFDNSYCGVREFRNRYEL